MLLKIMGLLLLFGLSSAFCAVFIEFMRKKNINISAYRLKYDLYIYSYTLFFALCALVCHFFPSANDAVYAVSSFQFYVPFICSFLLYLLFLLEMPTLLNAAVVVFSFLCVYLIKTNNALIFGDIFPLWAENLIVGFFLVLFVFGLRLLNRVYAVFSTYMLFSCLAMVCLCLAGALPFVLAQMMCLWAGFFAALMQTNFHGNQFDINDGGVVSLSFLLGCVFVFCANELAESAVWILALYPLLELFWSLTRRYVLLKKSARLSDQAIYVSVLSRDFPLETLISNLIKLFVATAALALFQLYSPNVYSILIVAIVLNVWLLSKLYRFDEVKPTFKQINADLSENIKDEVRKARKTLHTKEGKR